VRKQRCGAEFFLLAINLTGALSLPSCRNSVISALFFTHPPTPLAAYYSSSSFFSSIKSPTQIFFFFIHSLRHITYTSAHKGCPFFILPTAPASFHNIHIITTHHSFISFKSWAT